MIDDAAEAGCECVKFQCHVIEDEMIPNDVIPGNATESIWDIMARCALDERDERALKTYAERLGLIYLSTPFSRAAADRLERWTCRRTRSVPASATTIRSSGTSPVSASR